MTTFKLRHWWTGGPHRRVTVFAGPDRDHLANCGDLTFREQEARDFFDALAIPPGALSEPEYEASITTAEGETIEVIAQSYQASA
jgi:hypothetical protein